MSLSIHKLLSVSLLLATSATFVSVGHASVDEGSPTGRIGRRSRAQLVRAGAALSDVSSVPMAKEVKGGKGSGVTIRPPRRPAAIILPTAVTSVDSTVVLPSAPPATAPSPTTSAPLAAAAAASVPARASDPTDEGVSAAVTADSGAPALATSTTDDLLAAESAEPALPFGALTGSGAKGEDDDPALPETPPSSPVSAAPSTPPAPDAGGDDEGEERAAEPTAAQSPTVDDDGADADGEDKGKAHRADGAGEDHDGEGFHELDAGEPPTLEELVAALAVEKTEAGKERLTKAAKELLEADLTAAAEAYQKRRLEEAAAFSFPHYITVHPYSPAPSAEFNNLYGTVTEGLYWPYVSETASAAASAPAASDSGPATAASAAATSRSAAAPLPSVSEPTTAASAASPDSEPAATASASASAVASVTSGSAAASHPYSFETRRQSIVDWVSAAILRMTRERAALDGKKAAREDGVLDDLAGNSTRLGARIDSYRVLANEALFHLHLTHKFMAYTVGAISAITECIAGLEDLAAQETNPETRGAYQEAIVVQREKIAALQRQALSAEAFIKSMYPFHRPWVPVPLTLGLISVPSWSPNGDRSSVTGYTSIPSTWTITHEMLTNTVGDKQEHFRKWMGAMLVDPAVKLRAAMDAGRIVFETAPTAASGASAAAAAAADDAATCAGAAAAAASSDPAAGAASGEAAAALTSSPAEAASREGVAAVGGSSVGDAATAPAASASPPAATAQTPAAGGGWFSWLGRRNEPAPAN